MKYKNGSIPAINNRGLRFFSRKFTFTTRNAIKPDMKEKAMVKRIAKINRGWVMLSKFFVNRKLKPKIVFAIKAPSIPKSEDLFIIDSP
jgi:hypothetical protein